MEDPLINEQSTPSCHSLTNQLLSALPIITLIFPSLSFFATGITYYFQGRFINYIPTISETGTDYPNKIMFIFIFPGIALCSYYTMIVVMKFVDKEYGYSKRGKIWAKVTMHIGALGLMLIGMFPLNENRTMHLSSAGIGMFNVVLFEMCTYLTIGDRCNKGLKFIRWLSLLSQWVGGAVFGLSTDVLPNRISTTISAIGEVACIFMMQIFFFTFAREIANYQTSILSN